MRAARNEGLIQVNRRGLTGRGTMHWLEGADHSFHVLKSSGRTDEDVLGKIAEACDTWVSGLSGRRGAH